MDSVSIEDMSVTTLHNIPDVCILYKKIAHCDGIEDVTDWLEYFKAHCDVKGKYGSSNSSSSNSSRERKKSLLSSVDDKEVEEMVVERNPVNKKRKQQPGA